MIAIYIRDIIASLISYLLGAVPFSYLIARWRVRIDIYEHGEGNVGARNVYHVVGAAWGVLAACLDTAKGLAAYLIARRLGVSPWALLISGFAVPLGHGFSPFLCFRGGKGVAAAMGFLLGFLPLSTLSGGLIIFVAYVLTRDVNRALVLGIPGVILLPLAFGAPWWTVPYILCLFLMLGAKKALDRPHERAVWARDPWDRGQPGFHQETAERGNEKARTLR